MSTREPFTAGDPWGESPGPLEAFESSEGDRYEPGAVLGEGGMGQVLEAWDPRLRRTVALKVAQEGTAAESRLLQEARLGAQLRHPGVIPVLDAGVLVDGRRYLVLPRLTGRTLREHLSDRPAPRLDLLPALVDAARGVGHAHTQGIVHRDLTPGNVFVEHDGSAIVLDWGLARPVAGSETVRWSEEVLQGPDTPQTIAGTILGTPGFMSPEQALGAPVDPRADVWCLGAVLHVVLTGVAPLGHLDPSERQRALAHADVPDPRTVFPELSDLPEEVVEVCLRALARDPADRPADGAAFAAALLRARTAPDAPTRAWQPVAAAAGLLAVVAFALGRVSAPPGADGFTRAALHLEQARRAADRGAWPEAERHAIASLELQPSPAARGVLSAATAGWRAQRVATTPLPDTCEAVRLAQGGLMVCADGREVGVWSLEGVEQWRRVLEAPGARLVVDGDVVGVWSTMQDLVRLDLHTGEDAAPWKRACCLWTWQTGASGSYVQSTDRIFRLGGMEPEDDSWPLPVPDVERALVWQTGGETLALRDGWDVVRWDASAREWRPKHELPPSERYDAVELVRVSTSGETLLTTFEGRVRIGMAADQSWWQLPGRARDLHLSADGTLLAAAVEGAGVVVLDARGGAELLRLPEAEATAVRWQRDGRLVVVADALEVWQLESVGWARQLDVGPGVTSLAWDATHDRLAAGTAEHAVWLDAPGRDLGHLPVSLGVVKDVAWSPDGTELLTATSVRPSLHLIDPTTGRVRDLQSFHGAVRRAAWPAEDAITYARYGESGPQLMDPTTETIHTQVGVKGMEVRDLAVSPDGSVVHLGLEGRLARVDTANRRVELTGRAPAGASHLTIGPDDTLWVIAEEGLHRRTAGAEAFDLVAGLDGAGTALATSADGGWVVAGTLEGRALVFTTEGELAAELVHGRERVAALAFGDGVLFSGDWDGVVRTWEVGSWTDAPPRAQR